MKELNAIAFAYFTLCIVAINSQRPIPLGQSRCYRRFYHQLLYLAATGILHGPDSPSETLFVGLLLLPARLVLFPCEKNKLPFRIGSVFI
ncbi:Uncharacterised protein [Serratia quinivorans]|nr:Uncharacterised protein [Serratia quinivorans]